MLIHSFLCVSNEYNDIDSNKSHNLEYLYVIQFTVNSPTHIGYGAVSPTHIGYGAVMITLVLITAYRSMLLIQAAIQLMQHRCLYKAVL